MVPTPGKRTVDQPGIGKCTVITYRPVARAKVPLGAYRLVRSIQRRPWDIIGVRGVTENRGFYGLTVVNLKGQLAGIVVGGFRALQLTVIECEKA